MVEGAQAIIAVMVIGTWLALMIIKLVTFSDFVIPEALDLAVLGVLAFYGFMANTAFKARLDAKKKELEK